jgi:hypothetical protein
LRDGKTPTPASAPAPKPLARPAATSTPKAAAPEKPRVQETKAEPAPAGVTDPGYNTSPAMTNGNGPVDFDSLWDKALEQIRARRPLIRGWIESARLLGEEGRYLLLGFPPEQKTAMESIAMPKNRDFLEQLLKEISGRDWNLKFTLKDGLVVQAPKIDQAEKPREKPAAVENFKDDPLIREALEIFKGEIKPVTD